jgi:hypothetical protein
MGDFDTLQVAVTIPGGTTLREAIRQLAGAMNSTTPTYKWAWTVDLWDGLRLYKDDGANPTISDYSGWLANDDTPLNPAEPLTYGIDAAGYRGVIVKGTGVTQYVEDGTGKVGPIGLLTDSTITTAAQALAAGLAFLAGYASPVRGTVGYTDVNLTTYGMTNAHPGSSIQILDTRVGLATVAFTVSSIAKTFNPSGRENWVVGYGGVAPSAMALMRRLTQSVRA